MAASRPDRLLEEPKLLLPPSEPLVAPLPPELRPEPHPSDSRADLAASAAEPLPRLYEPNRELAPAVEVRPASEVRESVRTLLAVPAARSILSPIDVR